MIGCDLLEMIWKEAIVASFTIQHLPKRFEQKQ
jgi:hypothetical protein